MAIEDVKALKERLLRDIRQFSEGGSQIIEREGDIECTSLRTAANQFRQAAIALDQLDGLEQTLFHLRAK